ncbi:MAG: ADP-ribosylglycohydrolase family protein [Bacteroidetes bacterium]|nr:ADP-ribosylglycohydrolase family protein [Bacteroidota bacterium]
MLGAIAGDVIGSVFEWDNCRSTSFPLFVTESDFTDDTVLTVAVADWLVHGGDLSRLLHGYARAYPGRGYGGRFKKWIQSEKPQPYNSFGNGSAMRVSPVGFAATTLVSAMELARESAQVTHNHPEGIKGAQAVTSAIFLARHGAAKTEIREHIISVFEYDLGFTPGSIRDYYQFDETCQGSVPQAIVAFLESSDFESAIRLAISIGGDSDTIACITGGIAAAFYNHIPDSIYHEVTERLPDEFLSVLAAFDQKFPLATGG